MIAKVLLLLTIVAAAHSQVLWNTGLASSPILLSNGMIGASPLALRSGIVSPYSPIGLRSGIVSPYSAIGLRSAVLSNGVVTLIKK